MPFVVGCVLGHYRIIDQIGEGGMGVVYRAHDERLHRDVAIKVLPEEFISDSGRMERFEREARAAAALSHSNILAIHELGFHQGSPYIVTELLEGASLAEAMQGPEFSSRRALEIGIQVARGLAAAHDKGVIHRDLKPGNVFVTRDRTVKILDFGLAKLDAAAEPTREAAEAKTETMQTAIGTVMGTAGYMSPEQVRGHPTDARSDIFSFGVLLYEMLTGSNPFRRPTAADSVSAVLSHDPPAVSRAGGGIPAPVDAIVGRCLEKRPEDRYQSSRDLVHALETAVNAPSQASIVNAVSRFRIPRRAAAVAAVIVMLAVGAAFLASRSRIDSAQFQVADPDPPRIVVLPFDNLGADDDAFFAAGMSDEIMSRLRLFR